MNAKLERFNPLFGLLGLILVLFAIGAYLVTNDWASNYVRIPAALGAALLVYWVLGAFGDIKNAMSGRSSRVGANALLAGLAFIAILGFLNFLSTRYSTRWDLTANKQFAISQQTVQVLGNLREPITIQGFYTAGDTRRTETQDLFKEYTSRTDKLNLEFIDPDQQPTQARNAGVRVSGTLVFTTPSGKREEVTSVTESSVTGALIRLQQTGTKKIYFTTANGEVDITSADQNGMASARDQLKRLNYEVEPLNLLTSPVIPPDAAAVVVAGPRRTFSSEQARVLEQYAAQGGRLLLLLDPQVQTNLQQTGLETLLQTMGVQIPNGIVVDPALSLRGDIGTLIIQSYKFSAITKDFGPNTPLMIPGAGAVVAAPNAPNTLRVQPIAETSPQSWLETNPAQPQFNQDVDRQGPLPIATIVERVQGLGTSEADKRAERARLVIIGDSDFATNQYFNLQEVLNGDFFLNSVNWLAEEESLISIAPKPPDESRRMVLSPIQQNLVLVSSVLFLPLVVLGAGAAVWWQRR